MHSLHSTSLKSVYYIKSKPISCTLGILQQKQKKLQISDCQDLVLKSMQFLCPALTTTYLFSRFLQAHTIHQRP